MKKKILALYSTIDGQTIKIMEQILQAQEGEITLLDIDKHPQIDMRQYDKVLIGASIRYGNFRGNVLRFVNEHKKQLDQLPNAFFLVCLTARKLEKASPANNAYMAKFDRLSTWHPRLKGVFAGALLYSRYNWWQTLIIQLIMKITGGSTDTSQDLELTNWQQVKVFSQHFAAL